MSPAAVNGMHFSNSNKIKRRFLWDSSNCLWVVWECVMPPPNHNLWSWLSPHPLSWFGHWKSHSPEKSLHPRETRTVAQATSISHALTPLGQVSTLMINPGKHTFRVVNMTRSTSHPTLGKSTNDTEPSFPKPIFFSVLSQNWIHWYGGTEVVY